MTITRTVDSIYNPNQLTRDELIDRFVVRGKKFEQLYRHIHEAKMEVPEEYLLIIGQRGMGKTTLLLRLAYEVERDPKLNNWLIPIVFKEEQYGIRKLFNLWEETAHLLADKDAHFEGLFDEMDALYTNQHEEEHYEKQVFNLLIEKLQTHQKKIILFIDNLQDLLKKLSKQEGQRLRKILITCPELRIIAASPVSIDALQDYKHPLFEHFKTFHLKGLGEEETVTLIRKLGESYKPDEVDDLIKNQRARIETIRRITGGVIRTNVLLFEIFVDDRKGDVFRDLERLLDRVTPLYKDRTDDLPKNQQVIIDAIALAWDATTTKEIKQRTRLESKVISAQLAQLAKNDWIEIIPTNTKNHLYRLKERFYNIWYLMRNGRKRDAQRVLWLVQFLEDWLDENGTKARIEKMIKCFQLGEYDEKGAFYMTEALIRTSHIYPEDEDELLKAAKSFLQKKKSALAKQLSKSDVEILRETFQKIIKGSNEEEIQSQFSKIRKFNDFSAIIVGAGIITDVLDKETREDYINILKNRLLRVERTVNNKYEMHGTLVTLIAIEEYDFLYDFFNSDFANEHNLKGKYAVYWYALAHCFRSVMQNEYLKMGLELEKTVKELIESINIIKGLPIKKIPHQTVEDSDK